MKKLASKLQSKCPFFARKISDEVREGILLAALLLFIILIYCLGNKPVMYPYFAKRLGLDYKSPVSYVRYLNHTRAMFKKDQKPKMPEKKREDEETTLDVFLSIVEDLEDWELWEVVKKIIRPFLRTHDGYYTNKVYRNQI